MTEADEPVLAAGAVVWRRPGTGDAGGIEICLVHRPKYDDWSLPKGKLDPGEHPLACAVREVAEETGHHVVLGRPLPVQHYQVDGRPKQVRYWLAEAGADESSRTPDAEVDRVEFVPVEDALERLTYRRDAELVAAAVRAPMHTTPLVLLRHTQAQDRSEWTGTDAARRLTAQGVDDAARLVAPLAALGIRRILSSDAVRCADTVTPFARQLGVDVGCEPLLSETALASSRSPHPVADVLRALLDHDTAALLCSHRPVLPLLFEAVGVEPTTLAPGSFAVVHHRFGDVVAIDRHDI